MSTPSDEIFNAVRTIVSDLFGVDADSIDINTHRDSVDGWDSLQQVNLVMDIESYFQIHLSESQIARIQGIEDLVEIISEVRETSLDS